MGKSQELERYKASDFTSEVAQINLEMARQRDQVAVSWPSEDVLLRAAGLREDSRVLECACGPGYATERLAAMVPRGRVVGVDRDPDQLRNARKTMEASGATNYEILEADIFKSPLPKETFDFCYSRLSYQWFEDIARATHLLYDSLVPGGTLAVFDVDFRIPWFVLPKSHSDAIRRLQHGWERYLTERGANCQLGFELARDLLPGAGFRNVVTYLATSSAMNREEFERIEHPHVRRHLVRQGIWSQQDLEQFDRDVDDWLGSGKAYMLKARVFVSGRK